MKKISVIIPCYNVEDYIDRCVRSLVSQTIGVECLELIFVDDASTDDTVNKLSLWESRYPQSILVVVCEENGRQGRARNIGMEYASAPYISYVDADDWVEPQIFQELYDKAVQYDVDVITCRSGRDYGDGRLFALEEICHNRDELFTIENIEDRKNLLDMKLGHVWGKLYKKDFILENGLAFPEGTTYEDNYFGGIMCFVLTSFYVLDKVYYHYFANPCSTVTARNSLHHLERLDVETALYEELCRRGYDRDFEEQMKGRFLQMYYLNSLHLIFMRFDELPYDILQNMRREVLERFPEYKESETYKNLPEISKGFCLTLETEMTRQQWDNLASNYRYLVKQKN